MRRYYELHLWKKCNERRYHLMLKRTVQMCVNFVNHHKPGNLAEPEAPINVCSFAIPDYRREKVEQLQLTFRNMGTKQGWTKKKPVIGLAERGGNVLAKAVDSVTGIGVLEFVLRKVDTEGSTLMADESNVYQNVGRIIEHKTVNHKKQYVDGDVHTNTLEGFWGLLKRAWYGQHHKYKVRFMPLYVAEAVWKYNNRKRKNIFDFFVEGCFA